MAVLFYIFTLYSSHDNKFRCSDALHVSLSLFFFFFFFWLHPWRVEVPEPGIEFTPQQKPWLLQWQCRSLTCCNARELHLHAFFKIFLVYLICNVLSISAVQQIDPAIHMDTFFFFFFFFFFMGLQGLGGRIALRRRVLSPLSPFFPKGRKGKILWSLRIK